MPKKAISISVDLARKATVTVADKISFCGRSEYTPEINHVDQGVAIKPCLSRYSQ
jgi:hypothetical protein